MTDGDGPDGPARPRFGRRTVLTGTLACLAGCTGLGGTNDGPTSGSTTPSTGGATTTSTPTAGPGTTDRGGDGTSTETATATTDPVFPGYETTVVRAETPDGETLGRVTAAVADTPDLRYTGLSDTPSLPEDYGMLFVFDGVSEYTFVMRRMDFPLDMLFVDADGTITVVHSAPAPGPGEDGESIRRTGRGQYVLEVNRGWAAERGVTAGDLLAFELP